jgi:hypothetical protein
MLREPAVHYCAIHELEKLVRLGVCYPGDTGFSGSR